MIATVYKFWWIINYCYKSILQIIKSIIEFYENNNKS
jgi:hypothetical protein